MGNLSEPYDDLMAEDLQDEEFAVGYLNEALKGQNPRLFLIALRRVAKARGIGMSELSQRLGQPRRGLYYALSPKGNPNWTTLYAILDALGIDVQLSFRKGTG